MSRSCLLFPTILALNVGCTVRPAHFETSDAPPPASHDDVPLPALQVSVQSPAEPRQKIETTAGRFLLALENRAPEQLEALLAPGATLREQSSGSGSPALPALLELSRSWAALPQEDEPAAGSTAAAFGPAEVIELQTREQEAWATIAVDGPPKVHGLWKVRFDAGHQTPLIEEVILPKGK